jgi:hypothetical protein
VSCRSTLRLRADDRDGAAHQRPYSDGLLDRGDVEAVRSTGERATVRDRPRPAARAAGRKSCAMKDSISASTGGPARQVQAPTAPAGDRFGSAALNRHRVPSAEPAARNPSALRHTRRTAVGRRSAPSLRRGGTAQPGRSVHRTEERCPPGSRVGRPRPATLSAGQSNGCRIPWLVGAQSVGGAFTLSTHQPVGAQIRDQPVLKATGRGVSARRTSGQTARRLRSIARPRAKRSRKAVMHACANDYGCGWLGRAVGRWKKSRAVDPTGRPVPGVDRMCRQ